MQNNQNSRKLPPESWLRANGYSGLVRAMNFKPERFAHLKPAKKI